MMSDFETYPLSFAQQRLWFFDQWKPHTPMYIVPLRWSLYGSLDVEILTRCFNEVIRRHEILRTTFEVQGDEPVQVIAPALTLEIPRLDWRALPQAEQIEDLRQLSLATAVKPFDLTQLPLLRAQLVWLADEEHLLMLDVHHIVYDGWSTNILRQELMTLYTAFRAEQPSPLPELSIQYADFALWQREELQEMKLRPHLEYWKTHFTPLPEPLVLPTDHPRPATQGFVGDIVRVPLPTSLLAELDRFSHTEKCTTFMTLLAVLSVLLARYSGQTDIVIGTPIAGRTQPELETLIGFFVNTLALRFDLSANPTFRELLSQVRQVALNAYDHQDMPFEKLVEALAIKHNPSQNPLFQTMLLLVNETQSDEFAVPGLRFRMLDTETTGTSKFDLVVSVFTAADEADISFEYNTEIFDAATLHRLGYNFHTLLENILQNPEQRVLEVALLSADEQQQLLDWSHDVRDYRAAGTIQEQFAAQAQATPEQLATVHTDERLTYAALHARAQSLATLITRLTATQD